MFCVDTEAVGQGAVRLTGRTVEVGAGVTGLNVRTTRTATTTPMTARAIFAAVLLLARPLLFPTTVRVRDRPKDHPIPAHKCRLGSTSAAGRSSTATEWARCYSLWWTTTAACPGSQARALTDYR